jgi:hypothetical protein
MKQAGVFLIAVMFSAHAVDGKIVPRLTGQEFIDRYFFKQGLAGAEDDEETLFTRQFAKGYLAGVADASQGRDWCDKTKVKTLEIDAEVAHSLRKLPPDVLQGDAARLIVEILHKKFPCP